MPGAEAPAAATTPGVRPGCRHGLGAHQLARPVQHDHGVPGLLARNAGGSLDSFPTSSKTPLRSRSFNQATEACTRRSPRRHYDHARSIRGPERQCTRSSLHCSPSDPTQRKRSRMRMTRRPLGLDAALSMRATAAAVPAKRSTAISRIGRTSTWQRSLGPGQRRRCFLARSLPTQRVQSTRSAWRCAPLRGARARRARAPLRHAVQLDGWRRGVAFLATRWRARPRCCSWFSCSRRAESRLRVRAAGSRTHHGVRQQLRALPPSPAHARDARHDRYSATTSRRSPPRRTGCC